MSHILSRVPVLGKFVDERFLEHRRRSSSIAGLATLCLTAVLFDYRLLHNHVLRWDLFALMVCFGVVKMSLFAWYRFND
jgi:hypothetical protein